MRGMEEEGEGEKEEGRERERRGEGGREGEGEGEEEKGRMPLTLRYGALPDRMSPTLGSASLQRRRKVGVHCNVGVNTVPSNYSNTVPSNYSNTAPSNYSSGHDLQNTIPCGLKLQRLPCTEI